MSYSDSYTPNPDGFIDVEPIDLAPPKYSFWQKLLGAVPEPPPKRVDQKLREEQCRTMFTKAALDHVGALSMQEQQMSSATPHAAARYRALIDVYTKKVIQEIEGW